MSNKEQAEAEKNAGNEAIKHNDFTKAAGHYSKAIELDPSNHVYYSNRSNAFVQLQRYEEALADANKTLELDPKFVRGYGRKGNALFFLGRYEQAAAAYEEGLAIDPNNESFREELERCEAFMTAAPFLKPNWADLLTHSPLTGPLMSDPKFTEKIQGIRANPLRLRELMSADKEIEKAYIVLSGMEQMLRETQKKEEARKLDEQIKRKEDSKKRERDEAERKKKEAFDALPKNKQDALLAKEAGNAAYKAGEFTKALEKYSEAATHDPTDAVFLLNMGAAHIALKEYEKTIEVCDKAIELSKEHVVGYETMGKIYSRKGKALSKLKRYREAVVAYDAGIVSHRDPEAVKRRNQAAEKARLAEEEAYLDPVKAEDAKNAGNDYFKQENWGDAIRSYSEAIKRNPKNPVYYSNRSISYMKVREYALALQDADKCVALDPSFVKEYYKALEAYDKGMKIDPQYPELLEWTDKTSQAIQRMRGGGEEAKGDAEEARQRALKDPAIQGLLMDGEVQNLMATLQSGNQRAAQEMIQKSPTLFQKWQTLSKAGIL